MAAEQGRRGLLGALLVAGLAVGAATVPVQAALAVERQTLRSDVLDGEARSYRVQLPDSYGVSPDRRYPTLYLLDGATQFEHVAATVRFLAQRGEIPESIVVALDSGKRVRDFTQTDWPQMWVGGGGAHRFKRFLAEELIPRIERDYRADGYRILSGHSAGGQFVLHTLATAPGLFRAHIALAPSLDWDDRLPNRELARALVDGAARDRSFLYVARADDFDEPLAWYEELVRTLGDRAPPWLRWQAQAWPDETHVGIPLLAHIDALRKLYAGYRFHNDFYRRGPGYAQTHFEALSRTLGWPVAVPEGVHNRFGYAALEQGRSDDARALFERNVRDWPNSANAHDSLADALARQGQWPAALQAVRRAIELAERHGDPRRSEYVVHLDKLAGQASRAPAARLDAP